MVRHSPSLGPPRLQWKNQFEVPLFPSGKFSAVALAVACLLAVSLLIVVGAVTSSATTLLVSDVLQTAVAAWAAYCCFQVARHSSAYLRQMWMLLAAALSLVAAAQALETHYQNIAHRPAVTPWPSDILFIFWVIPVVAMLLPRPAGNSGEIDWQRALDFAQVGVVGLSAYLYFFYAPSQWQVHGPQMVLKIMRLQLFRDIALTAAFLIRAVAVSGQPLRRFFGGMCGLFLLASAADVVYVFGAHPSAGQVGWKDIAWGAPYLFAAVFAAAWKNNEVQIPQKVSPTSRSVAVTQILSVCVPLLVLFMSRRIPADENGIALVAVTGSFILSAARFMLTNEKQRRIAEELWQAEAALRQSAEMFSTAFRASPDAMSISSLPDGRYLEVNDSFLRLTGYTQEEIVGKTAAGLRLWVQENQNATVLARLLAGEEAREEEFLLRTKKGEILSGQLSAAGIRFAGKSAVLGMVRDITARKRAEKLLRASEEKFRALVENMEVGVVLLGPRAEIQFANFAAQQMFGGSLEEARGKNASELGWIVLREDGTEIPYSKRPGPREIRTRQPIRNEMIGWRRPGASEILWTLGTAVPRFDRDGSIAGVIHTFANITERRQTEEALRQLSARLLQLQDEERRRLGRELHDSLAQSVLAVNLDLAQVARSSVPLDEKAKRAMSKARDVLKEMSREIRTLSYLLHPPVLDELGLASAVQEYAQGFSERSGIQLEVDLPANFGRLSQEAETALFRIVQECLSNIQRHSGSQTARIRLYEKPGCVELEVSDQGWGMEQRAVKDGNNVGARLGVGMLGMRERVVQLGGKLEVESNSSGTKVRATIPVKVEVSNAPSHPSGG